MVKRSRSITGPAVLVTLISIAGAASQAEEPSFASLALDLVNRDRIAQGLDLLELDPALCGAAEHHARDMLVRNYFDHRSPEGEDVMDRYAAAGGSRWLGVAENIFKCLACPEPPGEPVIRTMHGQWMQSKEHRETILSVTHSRFCFGIAADQQLGYAGVQTFAGPGGPRMSRQGGKPRVLAREAVRGFALALINDRRRSEGRGALRASAALSSDAEAFLESELKRDPTGRDPLTPERVRMFLSGHDGGEWLKVGVLLEACGGCGLELTDADIAYFTDTWFEHAAFRTTLLGREFDSFGIALAADGQGRKVVLGLFGDRGN